MADELSEAEFLKIHRRVEPVLRRALVAAYGRDVGNEATDDAVAWAWTNRTRMKTIVDPGAYLFRVGQSSAKKLIGRRPPVAAAATWHYPPEVDPRLIPALLQLTENQRIAVVLHHAYAMTLAEVAAFMGVRISTVQNHVERGVAKLRKTLEEKELSCKTSR